MSKEIDDIRRQFGRRSADTRREAALRLRGRSRGAHADESVALLLDALRDPDWRVRKSSMEVLIGEYPLELYIESLIGLLSLKENAEARNSAIEALVKLDKRATPYLVEAFGTPDAGMRKFIVDIIGEVADENAFPVLLGALGDEDENVKASAVECLGSIKKPSAVASLIEVLRGDDLWTAYPAAETLGKLGDKRAVPALIAALERKPLREPALRALGGVADAEALGNIVPLIKDRSKAVRQEALIAIKTLYHRGVTEREISEALSDGLGEDAVEVLLGHTQGTRAEARAAAILCLGLLKDEWAARTLLDVCSEDDCREDVKRALIYVCREKPQTLLPLTCTDNVKITRLVCEIMAEVASKEYGNVMLSFLDSKDGHVRATAALGLGRAGAQLAVEKIKDLLADPYEDVQDAAVRSLACMKEGLDIEGLLPSLKSENAVLRKNTALLLGAAGFTEAVSALEFAMKDGEASVRKAAVTALCMLDTGESARFVMNALADEDPGIRMAAAQKLGGAGREEHLKPVSLLLSDPDDMVKAAAARALGAIGSDAAVSSLVGLVSHENGFVVTAALDSLGKLGGGEAKEAIVSALSTGDDEIRRTAIKSLAGLPGTEDFILPFIKNSDWATRAAAAESLKGAASGRARGEMERALESEADPVVRKALEEAIDA